MPDGKTWTYVNDSPTLIAPGVDIVSTRTVTAIGADSARPHDVARGPRPEYLPFYTT